MDYNAANITPTFNDAAEGPENDPPPVETGGPDPLDGGAAERIEMTREFTAAADASFAQPPVAAPEVADPPRAEATAEEPPDPLASAQAELEQLKAGRPEPETALNHRPDDKRLIQIVHTEVERNRENRIAALEGYLEFARDGPGHDAQQRQDEGLELAM